MFRNRYNLNHFDNPTWVETNEGFLQIKGNILKSDSFMDYMDKNGVLREKIPKDILFGKNTKKSFLHKKVTLEHPVKDGKLTMISNENVNEFGKGTIIDVFENGECLGAILQVEDKNAIDFIKEKRNKGENIELSAGYSANLEHLKDNEYIQKDIVANHVAILTGKGRAGSDVKLIYNYLDYEEERMKLKFNGKELMPEELLAEATILKKENENWKEKYNASETERSTLATEKTTLEEEKLNLTTEKLEMEEKYNALETEIKHKNIIEKAKEVFNSVDEKEEVTKIMEKIIKEVNPKFNVKEGSTVDGLIEMFNFSIETLSEINKKTKESNSGRFNSYEEQGLSLKIDNGYFSKKRNGGN